MSDPTAQGHVGVIQCQQCGGEDRIVYPADWSQLMVTDHLDLVTGTSDLFATPPTPGEGIFASRCCGAIMTYSIEAREGKA